jgi:hypothetical protein
MIMDAVQILDAIVEKLTAEFPDRPRHDVERIAAEAWGLFSRSHDEESVRINVTEWFARSQL